MANLRETAEWVEGIYQIEKTDPVVGGEDGISNRQAKQLGNRTAYLKQEVAKRSPIHNPAFTGTPTAPTAAKSVNNQQIATTAFVKTAIAALVGSAPAALDTLAELATALGNDSNLKQVLLTEIGKKATQADFTALKNLLVGIPFPYPLSAVPPGCLAFNGQTFSTSLYPELAKKYPTGRLPDLRGEFIRGWDNGREVDSGRSLLSAQKASVQVFDPLIASISSYSLVNRSGDAYGNLSFDRVSWNNYQEAMIAYFHLSNTETEEKALADANYLLTKVEGGTEYYRKSVATKDSQRGWELGGVRPRNIAFQYICLAG